MALARKLQQLEADLDKLIQKHEETLALVKRRGEPKDDLLIDAIEETIGDLVDAHVHNTDARSFERAYRKRG